MLLELWTNPEGFTGAMLGCNNSVMREIAKKLDLNYHREYYTLDAVFYENKLRKDSGVYAENLTIALEHENDIAKSFIELNKLCIINASLKVLITYPKIKVSLKESIKKYEYDKIVQKAKIPDNQIQMIIFGIGSKDDIEWQSYIYQNGRFIRLEK